MARMRMAVGQRCRFARCRFCAQASRASDFAEGDLVEEIFAIRFGNAENATKFKEAFSEAQTAMAALKGGEDGPADPAADEAADALSALKAGDAPDAAPAEA
mgnify:CR=1 FL=1